MATAVSVDLRNIAANLAYASGTGVELTAANVIRNTAEQIRAKAQALAPVKTGTLRESITIRYDGGLKATVGPEVPYGVYQEFGTGTRGEFPTGMYQIRPKRPDGRLVFKVNGKWVSAKVVNHPGIPPHPYMRPAVTATLGQELAQEMANAGALIVTQGKIAS